MTRLLSFVLASAILTVAAIGAVQSVSFRIETMGAGR